VTPKDTESEEVRQAVDLQFGPDNVIPQNGDEIYRKERAGTCSSQRADSQALTEIMLANELAGKPGTQVAVCVFTTRHNYFDLLISSTRENGTDPYRVSYTAE
jgi:hypothetical protein